MNVQHAWSSCAHSRAHVLLLIAVLSVNINVNFGKLELVLREREEDSNTIRAECEEYQLDGTKTILTDIGLFRCNQSQVQSLLDREDIMYEFSDGLLTFEIQQDIEGYYYCGQDSSAEVSDNAKEILSRPRSEAVLTYYERSVGESVTLRSGVGEGALAEHYTVIFTRQTPYYEEFTNVSRGEDFSLTLTSLDVSDSGTYKPKVSIKVSGGGIFLVKNLPDIKLIVYKSPVIEIPPESVVTNEEETSVSFKCMATGGPHLRVSWFKDGKNLTKHVPSHYMINRTAMNNGEKVMTEVTIHRPTYTETGAIECIATIMDDERNSIEYRAAETAYVTVLESSFKIELIITKHKQIQVWVELKNSISLYPVTVIIYFTLTNTPDQRPQPVQTHSIMANTTVMVFQLEPHRVPERFREEDFYVQVALKVESVESGLVPSSLEMANTANLNEPTDTDCSSHRTHQFAIVVGGGTFLGVLLLIVVIFLIHCIYKSLIACHRTYRRSRMSAQERQQLIEQNMKLIDRLNDPQLRVLQGTLSKLIESNSALLRGDGREGVDGDVDSDTERKEAEV